MLISALPNLDKGNILNLECAYMRVIGYDIAMINRFSKKTPARVKEYVRENWGSPFIVGFLLLLIVAAVSLSMEWVVLADGVAVVAYCALIVGVVLQLVCFLK